MRDNQYDTNVANVITFCIACGRFHAATIWHRAAAGYYMVSMGGEHIPLFSQNIQVILDEQPQVRQQYLAQVASTGDDYLNMVSVPQSVVQSWFAHYQVDVKGVYLLSACLDGDDEYTPAAELPEAVIQSACMLGSQAVEPAQRYYVNGKMSINQIVEITKMNHEAVLDYDSNFCIVRIAVYMPLNGEQVALAKMELAQQQLDQAKGK